MATCFPKVDYTMWDHFIIRVLQNGPIPKHIAFILDGNRRYANKFNLSLICGHSKGFVTCSRIWSLCRRIGISIATVYIFSIENFKRPTEELAKLFELFGIQFEKFVEELDICDQQQICIRFHGKLDLLPLKLQKLIAKITFHTAKNSKFYLNICFSYTSREEIQNAISDLREGSNKGIVNPDDIDQSFLSASLYSCGIDDPDIVLRSSGEIRLSDYQLWQSGFSHIAFVENLWPSVTHGDIYKEIFKFQINYRTIGQYRANYYEHMRKSDFVNNNNKDASALTFQQYQAVKREKLAIFTEYIKHKRSTHLKTLFDGDKK